MSELCGPANGKHGGPFGGSSSALGPRPSVCAFFSYELSGLAATRPDVLASLCRILAEALGLHYRMWATSVGLAGAQTGAVTFVHRFGSSLNLHTHFHVMALDGVYVERDARLAFFASPPPTREALEALVQRVVLRTMKWLKRKGYVRENLEAGESNEDKPISALEALAILAMQRGTLETMRDSDDDDPNGDDADPPRKQGNVVTHLGFNLHAAVTITAHDDMGRERLCRYGARPPFSLAKLRVLKDGNVSYLVKKVGRGRAKRRVMEPVEFLARLSALIPPPRFPLVRFAGVLAPRSKWRARIVPRPPTPTPEPAPAHRAACVAPTEKLELVAAATPARPSNMAPMLEPSSPSALPARPAVYAQSLAVQSDAVEVVAPNIVSLSHWARLRDGELYAAKPRVDWSTLLRRTFDFDVKSCTKCGGRLEVRAVVTEPESAAKILECLARPRAPPRAA
jgi:Putative transposase